MGGREYFNEWATARPGAPVGLKFEVLKHFGSKGVPMEHRAALLELTLAAAARPYRCEDRGYAGLVRHLDGDDLRAGLNTVTTRLVEHDPAMAFYMQALLEHPDVPATRHSWRSFVRDGELP